MGGVAGQERHDLRGERQPGGRGARLARWVGRPATGERHSVLGGCLARLSPMDGEGGASASGEWSTQGRAVLDLWEIASRLAKTGGLTCGVPAQPF